MHFSILEKLGLGILLTAWVVWGANQIGDHLVHAENPEKTAFQVAGAEQSEKAEKAEPAEKAEAVDALTLLASADVKAGAKTFKKCASCHDAHKDGKNKVGPNLWDVVGRPKGSHEGFKYSSAMTDKGGEWTYQDLDHFLADPKAFVKGTKMSFAGLRKASDRAAVILYLRSLSDSPKPLP